MPEQFNNDRNTIIALLNSYRLSENSADREKYLLALFRFQYKYNKIYRDYCANLKINPEDIRTPIEIPYLPISAYKHHIVKTGDFTAEEVFKSSGTTGLSRSNHYIRSVRFYHQNTAYIWKKYFDTPDTFCFLALLPGYLERDGSSLISMVHHFIGRSGYSQSGFFLHNHQDLYDNIIKLQSDGTPVVLFGVSYALLDFVSTFKIEFPEIIVIETGGMKGQRKEMTKSELHDILMQGFGTNKIYSEYGMTELLSQAYTKGGNRFLPNPMMIVHTKQINDPLSREITGKSGIICIADFANLDSCAFIQTEDQGICYADGSFEITGRLLDSDIRGCNLLLEEMGL